MDPSGPKFLDPPPGRDRPRLASHNKRAICTSAAKMGLAKVYLLGYNAALIAGWGYVLVLAGATFMDKGAGAVYAAVEAPLLIAQTAACMEVLHAITAGGARCAVPAPPPLPRDVVDAPPPPLPPADPLLPPVEAPPLSTVDCQTPPALD